MRSPVAHHLRGDRGPDGHVHAWCSCHWQPAEVSDARWTAEVSIRHWAAHQPGGGGALGVSPHYVDHESPVKLAAALGAPVVKGRVHLYVAGDQIGVWGLAPFAARGPIEPGSALIEGNRASLFITEHEARAHESRDRVEYAVPETPQRAFRVSVPGEMLQIPEWQGAPWGQRRFHARVFRVEAELPPGDDLAAVLARSDQQQRLPQSQRPIGDPPMMSTSPSWRAPFRRRSKTTEPADERTPDQNVPGAAGDNAAAPAAAMEAGTEAERDTSIEKLTWFEDPDGWVMDYETEAALEDAAGEGPVLARAASEAAEISDRAAAWGELDSEYAEALADQAAALPVLPTLHPDVRGAVEHLEAEKGRPITLAEVRWLEHSSAGARHHTDAPAGPTQGAGAGYEEVGSVGVGTEAEAWAHLERLDAKEAAERAAEDAERDAEWAVQDLEADAASWAADAGANADLAAAYGWLYNGYEEARADQAAAREALPGVTVTVRESVAEFEERRGRPITLAELRYMEFPKASTQHRTDDHRRTDAPASPDRRNVDEVGSTGERQAGPSPGRTEERMRAVRRGADTARAPRPSR